MSDRKKIIRQEFLEKYFQENFMGSSSTIELRMNLNKFSFQSFDFCVNSFVKDSLASDRANSKSEDLNSLS